MFGSLIFFVGLENFHVLAGVSVVPLGDLGKAVAGLNGIDLGLSLRSAARARAHGALSARLRRRGRLGLR